MIVVILLYTD